MHILYFILAIALAKGVAHLPTTVVNKVETKVSQDLTHEYGILLAKLKAGNSVERFCEQALEMVSRDDLIKVIQMIAAYEPAYSTYCNQAIIFLQKSSAPIVPVALKNKK